MQVTLSIQGLDYSSWSNQGQDGVWLGIGFGSQVMVGADMVMCQFTFSGENAADVFICTDRYASAYAIPPLDTTKDVFDVETLKTFNSVTKTCSLSATFKRKLNTLDTSGQDYKLRNGDTIDAIWAWGYIQSNLPNGHTSSPL